MKHRITIKKKFNKYGRLLELQIIVHYLSKDWSENYGKTQKSKAVERQESVQQDGKQNEKDQCEAR